jgi:hypothetical protein
MHYTHRFATLQVRNCKNGIPTPGFDWDAQKKVVFMTVKNCKNIGVSGKMKTRLVKNAQGALQK